MTPKFEVYIDERYDGISVIDSFASLEEAQTFAGRIKRGEEAHWNYVTSVITTQKAYLGIKQEYDLA